MARKDIFKIDNYMITFGILFLISGLAATVLNPRSFNDFRIDYGDGSYSYGEYNGRSIQEVQSELAAGETASEVEFPLIPLIIGISGFALLVIGITFRKKENKIISIWDALEKTSRGRVREMETALGLSRDFILSNLKYINAQQGSYYVYRPENDTIVEGRLLEEHSVSLNCPGCGNNINRKITLSNLDALKCSYCGASFQPEELLKVRADIVEENRISQVETKGGDFSLLIFLLLMIVFWPAAIIYLLIKRGSAAKKSVEAVKRFSRINPQTFSGSESAS